MKRHRVVLAAAFTAALITGGVAQEVLEDRSVDPAPAPATTGPLTHTHLGDGDPQPEHTVGTVAPRLAGTGPSQAGCTTKLISNNFSERSTKPSMFVLHYTVSPNSVGTGDVDGIRNFFNNPDVEVSSHYVIDWEGHCLLIVPESKKAWTQGNFNSDSISIEFIATGSEPRATWADKGAAGLRKGAKVVAASIKRNGIPFRYVDPVDCTPKAGITDHEKLECGNNHFDVEPNFPWKKFKRYLAAEMEPPKRCVRLQLTNKGEVLRTSAKFKSTEYSASLREFLKNRHKQMVEILKEGDGSYGIQRVKVVC